MRKFIDLITVPTVILGTDLLIQDYNDHFLKILDCREGSLVKGKRFSEFIEKDDRPNYYSLAKELLKKGQLSDIYFHLLSLKGKQKWISFNANLIDSSNKKLRSILITVNERNTSQEDKSSMLINKNIYKALLDTANAGVVFVDSELRVNYGNYKFFKFIDYTPEELSKVMVSYLFERKTIESIDPDRKDIRPGNMEPFEVSLINKDGSTKYYEATPTVLTAKNSVFQGVMVVLRDINIIKESIEKIYLSEHKFKSLIENAQDVIYIDDFHGRVEYINKYGANLFGSRQEDIIGKNLYELIGTEKADKVVNKINEVRMSRKSLVMSSQYKSSGKDIWLDTRLVPLKGRDGNVHAVMGIGRDMTDHINFEKTIYKGQEQLQFILEKSRTVTFSVDLKNWNINVSENIIDILGIKFLPESNDIKAWRKLIHPDDRENAIKLLATHLESGQIEFHTQFRVLKSDATFVWMMVSGQSIWQNSTTKPDLITGIMVDISALKATEENLENINRNLESRVIQELNKREEQQQILIQKSKLEVLGEMAAGIAHEINQPLGIMALILDNIQDTFQQGNIDDIYLKNRISKLFENISKIKEIIDHIRTFSREQRFKLDEEFSINEVVISTLSLIQTQYRNQQIELFVDINSNIPKIRGTRVKLEQVLQNLFSNSRYALQEKALKSMKTDYQKILSIKTYTLNQQIILEIWDNGTGISEKNLPHLFDTFFTTKGPESGTGLGLSICIGIIKELGGEIKFESIENEYTLARVILPIA